MSSENENIFSYDKTTMLTVLFNESIIAVGFDIEARHVFDHAKIKKSKQDDDLVGFEKMENSE